MIVSLEHVCFGYLKAMLLTVTDENRDQPLYYDRIFKKLLFLKHKEEQFKIEMDNQELLFEKERDLERRRREQEGLRDMYTAKTKNGSDEDRQYFSWYMYEEVDETPKLDLGIKEHLDQQHGTKDLEIKNVEEG